jgi:ABC-type transport system involved in Fe-S cluster assembly fused permease/ATPase subunit
MVLQLILNRVRQLLLLDLGKLKVDWVILCSNRFLTALFSLSFDAINVSGSGKSTIVGLLERFYDPKSGSIQLDGINLKDINVSHLRSMIGYVGQEPTLFATSIVGNIKYGNPDATQAEIEEAARMANAHDFISAFPE